MKYKRVLVYEEAALQRLAMREKYEHLPLTRINPPSTMTTSSISDAKTLATIMFLTAPLINWKNVAAI
jgi:hypothetical protein